MKRALTAFLTACAIALPALAAGAQPAPPPMVTPDVDAAFVTAATQGGNAELALAHLALARSATSEVRSFAQRMLEDHTELANSLRAAAPKPPSAPRLAGPDQLTYDRLARLPLPDFDQEYLTAMIGGHLTTLSVFQTEATYGKNPRLKALAARYQQTVDDHLQLAVDLTNHVGGSSPFKQH